MGLLMLLVACALLGPKLELEWHYGAHPQRVCEQQYRVPVVARLAAPGGRKSLLTSSLPALFLYTLQLLCVG